MFLYNTFKPPPQQLHIYGSLFELQIRHDYLVFQSSICDAVRAHDVRFTSHSQSTFCLGLRGARGPW